MLASGSDASGGEGAEHRLPDVALRKLTGDARLLWSDAGTRTQALQGILDAWDAGDATALATALRRVDEAVAEAMQVVGYPHGREVSLQIDPYGPRGRLTPNGELRLGAYWIRQDLTHARNPDTCFRTFVQESVHARQPFASDWEREYRPFRGYEEGLAEGLALLITRDRAGMMPALNTNYAHYVRAYDLLAEVVQVEPEALLRRLWVHPPGRLRENFAREVAALYRRTTGKKLPRSRREALEPAADALFDTRRIGARADDPAILKIWKQALP